MIWRLCLGGSRRSARSQGSRGPRAVSRVSAGLSRRPLTGANAGTRGAVLPRYDYATQRHRYYPLRVQTPNSVFSGRVRVHPFPYRMHVCSCMHVCRLPPNFLLSSIGTRSDFAFPASVSAKGLLDIASEAADLLLYLWWRFFLIKELLARKVQGAVAPRPAKRGRLRVLGAGGALMVRRRPGGAWPPTCRRSTGGARPTRRGAGRLASCLTTGRRRWTRTRSCACRSCCSRTTTRATTAAPRTAARTCLGTATASRRTTMLLLRRRPRWRRRRRCRRWTVPSTSARRSRGTRRSARSGRPRRTRRARLPRCTARRSRRAARQCTPCRAGGR